MIKKLIITWTLIISSITGLILMSNQEVQHSSVPEPKSKWTTFKEENSEYFTWCFSNQICMTPWKVDRSEQVDLSEKAIAEQALHEEVLIPSAPGELVYSQIYMGPQYLKTIRIQEREDEYVAFEQQGATIQEVARVSKQPLQPSDLIGWFAENREDSKSLYYPEYMVYSFKENGVYEGKETLSPFSSRWAGMEKGSWKLNGNKLQLTYTTYFGSNASEIMKRTIIVTKKDNSIFFNEMEMVLEFDISPFLNPLRIN